MMSPPTASRSPRGFRVAPLVVLLATTICLLFPSQALAQDRRNEPTEGSTRWMYGYINPQARAQGDSNALVLVRALSYGDFGYTGIVRGLGDGLPGCEVACIRKASAVRNAKDGTLKTGWLRKTIWDGARNEVKQHNRIQKAYDATGNPSPPFFPRAIAARAVTWPNRWIDDPETQNSVEFYQEFISGRPLSRLVDGHVLFGMTKQDVLSVGVAYMKGVLSALQQMNSWNPPYTHNDMHADNVMLGYAGTGPPPDFPKDRLPGRAYLIDFGLAKRTDPTDAGAHAKDLFDMRENLQDILEAAGINIDEVTASRFSNLLRSSAEKAVRKGYARLMEVTTGTRASPGIVPGTDPTAVFAELFRMYAGATEKYSDLFRENYYLKRVDPQVEPYRFRDLPMLIKAAKKLKVAGPWHPVEVTRVHGKWVIKQLQDDVWCDWDVCMYARVLKGRAPAGKKRLAPEEVEDWEGLLETEGGN